MRHIWAIFQHPMISPQARKLSFVGKNVVMNKRSGENWRNNDVHKNVSDRLNLVNVSQGFASPLINLLHFDFYGHTSRVLNQLSIRENPISQKPSFSENSARFFSLFQQSLNWLPFLNVQHDLMMIFLPFRIL